MKISSSCCGPDSLEETQPSCFMLAREGQMLSKTDCVLPLDNSKGGRLSAPVGRRAFACTCSACFNPPQMSLAISLANQEEATGKAGCDSASQQACCGVANLAVMLFAWVGRSVETKAKQKRAGEGRGGNHSQGRGWKRTGASGSCVMERNEETEPGKERRGDLKRERFFSVQVFLPHLCSRRK